MSQSIEERLELIGIKVRNAQTKRIQYETKLEGLKESKRKLIDQCKKLGVKPEELEAKIAELKEALTKGVEELEGMLDIEPEEQASALEDHPVDSKAFDDMPF